MGLGKILITGANGMLGSDLLALYKKNNEGGYEALGITRKDCDLTDGESLARLLDKIRPESIVHCAAFTNVDGCEHDRQKAFQVNGSVVNTLGLWAGKAKAHLVYISTDYVFDGKKEGPYSEEDPASPVTAYGQSKREGELAVLKHSGKGTIIRASWLFGQNGPNFVKAIVRKAKNEGKLRVVNDQKGSPTHTPDLAQAIFNLERIKAQGIFHVANSGECTWFEFAREIVEQAGILGVEIEPITTAELNRPAKRPGNSVLSLGKYNALTGKPLRHWREALGDYIANTAHDS